MSWKKVRLGDVATFVNGYPFKPTDWGIEGYEIIRIQNLTKGNSESNYFSGNIPEKYKVVRGDILISWSATLDIFVWKGNDAWLNQHIFKVVFDKIDIDKSYFIYAIKNILVEMRKQVHGATMQHITKGKFDNLEIPLPPLATQKRIAEILDAADALRRKDQELLKKYDELAQAIFIDMFGTNSNIVKLNEITTKITDGVHAKPNYQETGVPFLSVKNATNKFLDFNNSKFISQVDHEAYTKRCKPEFEDILYTKVGATYGRAAIIDSKIEFSIYVSLALIKPDRNKVYPYYLNFVLNTNYIKKQADRRVKGAGVPDLHLVEIKDFDIPLPSYKEQLDFSNVISNLNQNIIATKNQILESDNLFQTLIQKAFNGELVS